MSEKERAAQIDEDIKMADAKRRADAEEAANAGEKLDKVLAHLDSLSKRMDAFEAPARGKAEEGESEVEGEIEKDKPRELAADSRKDSQMIRRDSADDVEEIEHFKAETGATHAIAADSVLAAVQSEADRAASAWGKSAVHPWDGESVTAYRRRSARDHKSHSAAWKDVDLSALSGQALRNATAQIFADSIAASSSNTAYGDVLREVRGRNPDTGHLIKEYY